MEFEIPCSFIEQAWSKSVYAPGAGWEIDKDAVVVTGS